MSRDRTPEVPLRKAVRIEYLGGHGWVLRTVENGLMKQVYRTRRQARAAAQKYREMSVRAPSGCVFCDVDIEVHRDIAGPFHKMHGRRRACTRRKPADVDNLRGPNKQVSKKSLEAMDEAVRLYGSALERLAKR